MKILIVAATQMETKLLTEEFEFIKEKSHLLRQYSYDGKDIDVLITGIGTIFTTFHLTNVLHQNKYDLVLNVGIAGSLSRDLKIGEVVNVVSDEFADLGIEDKEEFRTLFEAGFIESNEFPFEGGILKATNSNGLIDLKKVRGITSNKSHGRGSTISEIHEKFSAHTESMEGAAVLFVCGWMGISCLQLRAVSNYVEPRDSSKWNIPVALENLKTTVLEVFNKLSVSVN